jgi:thiamine pyrophosphate-dependent acetolactate synthase large subunit-like protein
MRSDEIEGQPDDKVGWGSDIAATMLRRFGIPYVSLNPGASYRGLHDSLVNHLGNKNPSMVLALHEDHAVSIAHGYAKATGEPMACILHSNVGLMHGMMGLYNAWCDRVPMIVLGATGPLDAAARRPWIDWIHTSSDQADMIRSFVKWDNQPTSPDALVEAMARANFLTRTEPTAPVYVCLDAGLQESSLEAEPDWPDLARIAAPASPRPDQGDIALAAKILSEAKRPLILMGRTDWSQDDWDARVQLAERLGAVVFTDLKNHAAFPTDHPAHIAPTIPRLNPATREVVAEADAILSLDWVDFGGVMGAASKGAVRPKVIHASLDHTLHNGAHMNYHRLGEADVRIAASADAVVEDLLAHLSAETKPVWRKKITAKPKASDGRITVATIASTLREAVSDPDKVSFAALCRGFPTELWPFRDPTAFLGKDGGGGIGSGPGLAVGAALALSDRGRQTIAILGDGDFCMGAMAIWSAARAKIPLLMLINNNRSYFNDELHQETVARRRNRPVENRWIGQRISDPNIDIAKLAEAQGAVGIGPVIELDQLKGALEHGLEVLNSGGICVVDIHVTPGKERSAAETIQARS